MSVPIPPAARAILGRMVRSLGPWRVLAVRAPDRAAMRELVAAGLVEVDRGIYRPTPAGRAALTAP